MISGADRRKIKEWAEAIEPKIDAKRFVEICGILDKLPEFNGPQSEARGKAVLLALAFNSVRILSAAPKEATVFFLHVFNAWLDETRNYGGPKTLGNFDGPLGNTRQVTTIMNGLQQLLVRELGDLPDAILILRFHDQLRTLFAGNPNNFAEDEDPRTIMDQVLEDAVKQNREISNQLSNKRGTA